MYPMKSLPWLMPLLHRLDVGHYALADVNRWLAHRASFRGARAR